ncbi:MAG: DMT family transporter, partial [Deinococcus sp.]|nr:DMT family transporter [Deinococcus sp.]
LSWEGGSLNLGDAWAVGCAVTYAGFIIALEGMAGRHPALPFTLAQVVWVAALGWAWTLLSGSAPLPAASGAAAWTQAWMPLLYLGVLATALTTLLQTLGQRHVSAPVASLIYSLEPVVASVFSFLLIGEKIGPRGLLGGALVVASTVLSSQASGEAHPETPTPDAGRTLEDEDLDGPDDRDTPAH